MIGAFWMLSLAFSGPAAGELLLELDLAHLPNGVAIPDTDHLVKRGNRTHWRIETERPGHWLVLTIEDPPITAAIYALSGHMRYAGVDRESYLELNQTFPDGNTYFTRTLAESGPMGRILGNSDWRSFALPFNREPKTGEAAVPAPVTLTFRLVMNGHGSVELADLQLGQYASWQDALYPGNDRLPSEPNQTVVPVAIAFALSCLLILPLSSIRRGRRVAMLGLYVWMLLGGAGIILGATAFLTGQPSPGSTSLLPMGISIILVTACLRYYLLKRQRESELRKMSAIDA